VPIDANFEKIGFASSIFEAIVVVVGDGVYFIPKQSWKDLAFRRA
jgi:hypothetical protein